MTNCSEVEEGRRKSSSDGCRATFFVDKDLDRNPLGHVGAGPMVRGRESIFQSDW